MWPTGVFGVSGLVTFVDEPGAGWVVIIDPPWKAHGLDVGAFGDLLMAVKFVYGLPAMQQPLPLEWP
jgi:hypothetical protein